MKYRSFFIASLLVGFYSLEILAEEFKRCEVTAIVMDKDKKNAKMSCLGEKLEATWVPMSPPPPPTPQNCSQEELQAFNTVNEQLKLVMGSCKRTAAGSVERIIEGIDAHLAYFYMSLKEDLVLKKVKIEGKSLVYAELARHFRYNNPAGVLVNLSNNFSSTAGNFDSFNFGSFTTSSCSYVISNLNKKLNFYTEAKSNCTSSTINFDTDGETLPE
jgi:hypothetical protein